MQDDAEQTQRFGPIEFVGHRLARLRAQRGVGGGEVDQVAGVRDDRDEAGARDVAAELRDLVRWKRASAPLVGVLREHLQRVAPVHHRARNGARQATGDGHVRAERRHADE